MKTGARSILELVVLSCAIGCGSSGATGDGGAAGKGGGGAAGAGGSSTCIPLQAGDGVATWDDDGTNECATLTLANRMTSSTQDFLEIVGATNTGGIGIGLTVVSYTGPLGGTYHCKNDSSTSVYVNFVYRGAVQDCTITIDNAGTAGGAHATGSFSGTFTGTTGQTIEVTNGVFDTPVMVSGG